MNKFLQKSIAYLSLLTLVGCTSMQKLDHSKVNLSEELEVGDHVIVYTHDGRVIDMHVAYIDQGVMRGSNIQSGGIHEVQFDEITQINVEGIDGGQTSLAVLGGIILLPIAALGAGLAIAEQAN